jgi:hypothetical protein
MDGDLIFAFCVLADLEHREGYSSDSPPCHHVVYRIFRRLRSAVRRAGQVESERNARRRAADGSPPLLRQSANAARDERADLRSGTGVVARHTSDRQARETKQTARWSRRTPNCHRHLKSQFQAGKAFGISIENVFHFGILPEMSPRFSEMNKVRVNDRENEPYEGYVIDSQFRDGRWIYKLSISEDPTKPETYDNWLPEEWLERAK